MARPKKRKYPRLPNKFGSIKKLSGNRTNPYGVYPPTTEFDEDGRPKSVPALAYVDDWYYGFSILTAYHAGTYVPGVYPPPPAPKITTQDQQDAVIRDIIRDYNKVRAVVTGKPEELKSPTFAEVYEGFYRAKYITAKKRPSKSAEGQTKAAYKNCAVLHNRIFRDLRHGDLQKVVDDCKLKHASLELIVTLYHQMYAYADIEGLCDKDYSSKVTINIDEDDEQGTPFTEREIKILWIHKNDPTVEMLLIMCYSGYRISAYKGMYVDLEKQYFKGGVKNKTSIDRIVPIHPAILPLVERRLQRDGKLISMSLTSFRKDMYEKLQELGISGDPKHTPHDARHTFSWLCEHFNVNENDRKRMMGHSFGKDITNATYGHRTLDELKAEIYKIKVCRYIVTNDKLFTVFSPVLKETKKQCFPFIPKRFQGFTTYFQGFGKVGKF